MITLALDASTYHGTVAVLDDARLIGQEEAAMRGRDSELLMPAIATTLRRAGLAMRDIQRVMCGAGPGSFTSLRIAASIAKGLAVGRGIPLYATSSLALIVAGNVEGEGKGQRYLAVLDALRNESFVGEFEHSGSVIRRVGAMGLVANTEIPMAAAAAAATPVGPGQPGQWHPHVRGAARLLDELLFAGPVSLPDWEPVYGRLAEAQVRWEATHGRALAP